MFNSSSFPEAVGFYRSICPALTGLRDSPGEFSITVEDTLGEDSGTVATALRSAVEGIAERAAAGSAALPREAPEVPSVQQVEPVDYTVALDAVRDVLTGQAAALDAAADAASADGDDSVYTVLWDAVNGAAGAVDETVQELATTAALPNQKALDEVRASSECSELYSDPVVEPGTVHRPQVDLYAVLRRAHDGWQEVVDRYSGQQIADLTVMTADMAEAAESAVDEILAWIDANSVDPVEADITAARDAEKVYRGICDAARSGDSAGGDPQTWVNDEAKLRVRVTRVTPPVNRETADAVSGEDRDGGGDD